MPPGVTLQSDFTAGELSYSLLARVDFEKYAKGCKTLKNFFVKPHGGAVKRPGFLLFDALPGPATLIEFQFSTTQAYALVFGDKWIRFATHDGMILDDDGNVYEIESPFTLEQAREMSYTQSADVIYIAHRDVAPQKLNRYGHAHWEFEAVSFEAPLNAPTISSATTSGGGNFHVPYQYYVTAIDSDGKEGAVSDAKEISGQASNNWVAGSYIEIRWTPVTGATEYRVYRSAWGGSVGYVGTAADTRATLLTIAQYDALKTLQSDSERFAWLAGSGGGKDYSWYSSSVLLYLGVSLSTAQSFYTVVKSLLSSGYIYLTGVNYSRKFTISNSSISLDAPAYAFTSLGTTTLSQYVSGTTYFYWRDLNVTATLTETIPKWLHPFVLTDDTGETVYDYPGAVSLFQQRLVYASSERRPQTIWMSKSGDYANFATYSPLSDDSPMEMTIASKEVSPVNWMVPLRSMIVGTSSMEWELAGGDSAFSSTNKQATAQSYWGSSLNSAMIIGNIVLHVASSGRQVRNLQYDYASDSYGGIDLSILSGHLFEHASVVDWTYQKHPDSVVWCVMSDGGLLGLTFQSEHKIAAWHRHDTQGKFLSVTSMQYGYDYDLFAVIQRGETYYIERMDEQYYRGDPSRHSFVDCAITYDGEEEVNEISGLAHLEGMEVGVFSNGAVEAPKVVTDGKVPLDIPSKLVTVGLLYTADLQTMPVEISGQDGISVAMKKVINTINISFHQSMGVQAGITVDLKDMDTTKWQDVKWRTTEAYGIPPAPFSGIRHLTMPTDGYNQLSVSIRSRQPTPVAVQAIVSRITVNA